MSDTYSIMLDGHIRVGDDFEKPCSECFRFVKEFFLTLAPEVSKRLEFVSDNSQFFGEPDFHDDGFFEDDNLEMELFEAFNSFADSFVWDV